MTEQSGWSRRATIIAVLLATGAQAFAPNPAHCHRSQTSLNLLPEQGSQLAAAWNAAHAQRNDDDDDDELYSHRQQEIAPSREEKITPTAAARAFVSRLFHLPSQLHLHDRDEVLYPIVGFRWVKADDEHYRVLPTTYAASCRVPSTKEEVVGWFSPACSLGTVRDGDDFKAPPDKHP